MIEQWVDLYADKLYAFAVLKLKDKSLAEDFVQDTFLAALQSEKSFRSESGVYTWLIAILKNKIADYYRKLIKQRTTIGYDILETQRKELYFDEDGKWNKKEVPINWNIDDSSLTEQIEVTNVLDECIEKLPAKWGMLIKLKYLLDEDSEKICKDLKITPSNYWVMVHRAKLDLRKCIELNYVKK